MSEKIWFVSDTHFGHKNIFKFCPKTRKGATIEEHDQILIENWQKQVSAQDRVYHLGDMFFTNSHRAKEIRRQLPGQIHLVYGNHDRVIESNKDLRDSFVSVSNYKELRIDDIKVCLFHFPIHEWYQIHRGAFHLFGHVHGSARPEGRALDVGIDNRFDGDMKLWSWEEVKAILLNYPIRAHHDNKVDM